MTLPLNQQTSSLEYSKKLRELDVPQNSQFAWGLTKTTGGWILLYELNNGWVSKSGKWYARDEFEFDGSDYFYSAYTVGELGEMLPNPILGTQYYFQEIMGYFLDHRTYCVQYTNMGEVLHMTMGDTEADARAKMLIWLIEKEHLDVTNLKKGE